MNSHAGPEAKSEAPRGRSFMTAPPSCSDDPFTNFVRSSYTELHASAWRLTADEARAKDLVQQTYVNMWRTCPADIDRLNVSYAKGALTRAYFDQLREEGRMQRKIGEIKRHAVQRLATDPATTVANKDQLAWDLKELRELLGPEGKRRDRQMQVLWLTVVLGFTPKDIGEHLRISPATASNYLSIIRKRACEGRRAGT